MWLQLIEGALLLGDFIYHRYLDGGDNDKPLPDAEVSLPRTDVGAPVLVVSQFTLYADTRKGRRPTWNAAAPGLVAEPLVEAVADALRARGLEVATGVFGADMAVELVNDGPVTILLESRPHE